MLTPANLEIRIRNGGDKERGTKNWKSVMDLTQRGKGNLHEEREIDKKWTQNREGIIMEALIG